MESNESQSDLGPQKGPASLPQVVAQTKRVREDLRQIPGRDLVASRAVTIGVSGSTVTIECDDTLDAHRIWSWLIQIVEGEDGNEE